MSESEVQRRIELESDVTWHCDAVLSRAFNEREYRLYGELEEGNTRIFECPKCNAEHQFTVTEVKEL